MANEPRKNPSARSWTAPQLLAIRTTGRSLLVSAAAGSGKTSVLAERCVNLVCDAQSPCDVDELLVVTFTEAAAAEMRARINSALQQRFEISPTERLERQLKLVNHAQVSTLHSFCARLLRQHFHLVGLDPGFRVLDADEARLLRNEIARDLFERHYDDQSGDFGRLIDGYGQGNDELVLHQLLHVSELLTSVVDPAAWIARSRLRIADAIEKPLAQAELGGELAAIIQRDLASIIARCDEAEEKVNRLGFPLYAKHLAEIGAAPRYWLQAFEADGIDALSEVVGDVQWPRLPTLRGEAPGKELARSLVDAVKDEIKGGSWREILRFSTDQWRRGLALVRPHAEAFLSLLEEFRAAYQQAKRAVHAVDFSDLERFSLQALCSAPGAGALAGDLTPSLAARSYHRQFAHVLVDEYQDINEVQDAILSLVSRDHLAAHAGAREAASNLFCVGDVKQSIYRFRLAEPARFLHRQRDFRVERSHGSVIDLQHNFRSRSPLLDALNSVFRRLMTADAADIEYDQSHHLVAGSQYPVSAGGLSFAGAPIDLHLLPTDMQDSEDKSAEPCDTEGDADDLDRAEREAMFVAREIRRILGRDGNQPMLIATGKTGGGESEAFRTAKCSDIAVLLRSMKHKSDQFVTALRQAGINAHGDGRSGYFASMEVRDMLALLNLLNNRRDDIALAALLRSPLARLKEPESAMASVRAAYAHPMPFHEAVILYAKEKADSIASDLNAFFDQLDRWREAAQRQPLADAIWEIYRESGYLTFVSGLHNGAQRVENLTYLHGRAAQFGAFQSRGLSRFLRFLEQLQEDSDIGQPSIASEADDVVRVLSIHSAKGQEFPIVIVPDLGKGINLQDCKGAILADRSAGLGMSAVDEQKRCRYPSLASTLVQSRLKQQSLAEELRVLYVAMTRAKEHLILVGSCAPGAEEKWALRWKGHSGPLPRDLVLGARTMLDWLGPAWAAASEEPAPPLRLHVHSAEEVNGWATSAVKRRQGNLPLSAATRLEPLPRAPAPSPAAEGVIARLGFLYPWAAYEQMPAAQSVTARSHADDAFASAGSAPRTGLSIPTETMGTEPDHTSPADGDQIGLESRLSRSRLRSADAAGAAKPQAATPSQKGLIRPRFVEQAAPSAADRGTATHLVLQHFNFAGACDAADIGCQIEALIAKRILSAVDAALVDRDAIAWFLGAPIGRIMRSHPAAVRRELPVNFPAAPALAKTTEQSPQPLDRVMVRGRIDVLIVGNDSMTLLDYKTDSIAAGEVPGRAEVYRPQLQAYREAMERIAGKKIDAMYLAFLTPRKMCRLGKTQADAEIT